MSSHNITETSVLDDLDDEVKAFVEDPDSPIRIPLSLNMALYLAVSPEGQLVVFHDKPFDEGIEWLEFNAEASSMLVVTGRNRIQPLGFMIPQQMRKKIKRSKNAMLLHVVDGGHMKDMAYVPVVHELTDMVM